MIELGLHDSEDKDNEIDDAMIAMREKEGDARAGINSDLHDPGSQGSRVSRDLEQDRSQLKCDRCSNRLSDLDWAEIKNKGWDAEIVELAPLCSNCIDHWRVL